jgi:hypothetical protein
MSLEVPQHIGELSNWAFDEALAKVDRALADAPEDIRAALGVIRLVSDVPRRAPWYGVTVDAKEGVSAGTVMWNLVEYYWGSESYRERVKRRLEDGRREYDDYLRHLTDPLGCERSRLSGEQAAECRRAVAGYLG